jgi:hypothetical protein
LIAGALALLALGGVALGAVAGEDDRSAAPAARPGVIWAIGDGASPGPAARSVARLVLDERRRGVVDRFLYLGDVYEDGTAEEYAGNYAPVYAPLDPITSPTPGNHEWDRRAEGYAPYWNRARRGRPQPLYYRQRVAGWDVLSLNSETPDDPQQLAWLRRQVAAPGTCRIAFWHTPRFSAGEEHGDDAAVAPLWDAVRGRAALVLNGHEHNLQRFRPIDGTTQYVVGAGGRDLSGLDPDPRLAFGDDATHGALRIELAPGRARTAFRAADGRTLDRSETRCRPG